jgi:formiminoglutamase
MGGMSADLRLRDLLGSHGGEPDVVLLGFPSDEGIARNGGRVGAAAGPAAIRDALGRMTPDVRGPASFAALAARTRDLGDVAVTGDVERDQELLGAALRPHLELGRFAIVLGGGHETAFGHFLGYQRPVSILNWDAHADVRELKAGGAHSGSPFRQALEHPSGRCVRYTVAGLQPHAVSAEHLALVQSRGRAVFRDELKTSAGVAKLYDHVGGPLMVSFDLDAVDGAFAPGVSAPSTNGLPAALWLEAAFRAGAAPAVASADVVELSPPHDQDGQTARLAALTVWQILRGLATRTGSSGS